MPALNRAPNGAWVRSPPRWSGYAILGGITSDTELEALPQRDPREYLIPAYKLDPGWSVWRTPVVTWRDCDDPRRAALTEAWRRGELSYKLDPLQRRWYRAYREWESNPDREGDEFVFDVSRRVGKTTTMLLIALEDTIRSRPGNRQLYITSTEKMAKSIVRPVMIQLLDDCPPELAPTWFNSKSIYEFPSGAELGLVGMDVDPDRARGTHLDRGYFDEAAFVDQLEYILTSIIAPMMQGRPGACMLMGSTPPLTPAHHWSSVVVPRAQINDSHVHATIYDNPRLTLKEIEHWVSKGGGIKSTSVRRELLAEHVPEETMAVVPEYRDMRHQIRIKVPQPQWFYAFTGMDPGMKDATGIVYSFVDFANARLVVQAESLMFQANTKTISAEIHAVEKRLWSKSPMYSRSRGTRPQPKGRFMDVDLRLAADLAMDHSLLFSITAKDNFEAQVNNLRVAIQEGKIVVDPDECPHLDRQLLNAVYKNQNRKEFAREGDFGHFDLVASLIYTWRNVQHYCTRNPNPPVVHGPGTFVRGKSERIRIPRHVPRVSHRPRKKAR